MFLAVSLILAVWPWQSSPKETPAPEPVNPFERRIFIQYPSTNGLLEILEFTTDTVGRSDFYILGDRWTLGPGGFVYTVDPTKKLLTMQFNTNSPVSYNYEIDGRVVTLSTLQQTRELIQVDPPFFWKNPEFHIGENESPRVCFARQKAFLDDFIAEARRSRNNPVKLERIAPERSAAVPSPTPTKFVEYLAIPVDNSRRKIMLRSVASGQLRDDRVFELRIPLAPGEISTIDGVTALMINALKTDSQSK